MNFLLLLSIPVIYVVGGIVYCALIRNTVGVGLNRVLFCMFLRAGEITLTEEMYTSYRGYKECYGCGGDMVEVSYLSSVSDYEFLKESASMVDSYSFYGGKREEESLFMAACRVFREMMEESREMSEMHRLRLRFCSD